MEWLIVIGISAYVGYRIAKREERTNVGEEYYEKKKEHKEKDFV